MPGSFRRMRPTVLAFPQAFRLTAGRRACGPRHLPPHAGVGSIKSGLFISLDGVVESPNSWHFPYFNDEMGAAVGARMAGNDAMLLGRKTYAEFASYWPTADPDDPVTAQMNGTRKYVVSTTLHRPGLAELHRRQR